jgi:hypothetical protein
MCPEYKVVAAKIRKSKGQYKNGAPAWRDLTGKNLLARRYFYPK